MDFSYFNRSKFLEEMAARQLDLLVIGGGITGVGISLDAASRGLSVGLVEKQDFASGTSSRSTKLIHGGLRYLQQFDFGLVREVGHERAILYRNAPHLAIPEKMLLPIIEEGTFGWWAASFGIWIYDWLAGVERPERRKMLSRAETIAQEPLLDQPGVLGGALYYEYRTDDARLTIEVAKTAHAHSALCVNYAEAAQFIYEGGQIRGAKVCDTITGKEYSVRAKKIINATGAWVDDLRKRDGSLKGKRLHLTKGVHVVVPYSRFPLRESVYFDAVDGRMIFAIPRGRSTYIGTTDTNYSGPLETPTVTPGDIEYLLNSVRHIYKNIVLEKEDIKSCWAGIRPLIHEEGKSPYELSRKDEIFVSESGLISIAGGKLTGYRKMAQRAVDLALRQLNTEEQKAFVACRTDQIPLARGPLEGASMDAKARGEQIESSLEYCIQNEMAANLSDFLIRRTGSVYFDWDIFDGLYPKIAEKMSHALHWSADQKNHAINLFERDLRLSRR